MAIDPVTGATSTTENPTVAGNSKTDGLGREAFLTLLVTQLQHQNPLEPQPDGEFLAQLAQFSSLESLQGIRSDMSALRSLVETGTAAGPTS